MKIPLALRSKPAPMIALLLTLATLAYAAVPPRAEISSVQFSRSQPTGLESTLSRPGTQVKILLTHSDSDWRALDFDSCQVTAFVDGREANLALPDSNDSGAKPGLQPEGTVVAPDGEKAVLTIWGGGIPANGVDELRVAGSAALFCGPSEEKLADRADIRVAGGETFNVQPFRVVTSHGGDTFNIELRYLKSEAFIKDVSLLVPGARVITPSQSTQSSEGQEWAWSGSFLVPPRIDRVVLTVHYLPIVKVDTVPFDLTTGLAFGTPSTNPIVRWIKKYI